LSDGTLVLFEQWLAAHNSLLAISMLVIERASDSITLRFAGIIRAIEVDVLCDEIVISVSHDTLNWDTLLWLDCEPKAVGDGVVCDLCEPAQQRILILSGFAPASVA
jgi:hypothetical protein